MNFCRARSPVVVAFSVEMPRKETYGAFNTPFFVAVRESITERADQIGPSEVQPGGKAFAVVADRKSKMPAPGTGAIRGFIALQIAAPEQRILRGRVERISRAWRCRYSGSAACRT